MWLAPEKRFMRHICLRNPFLPLLLGIPSIQSLPEATGSWKPQYVPPALRYSWIMPSRSLQLQKKTCLTQRSRGFGHGVVVSKMCYSVSIQWLCSQLCYVTAANQWTIVEIELLATVGWKCGCQPFGCRCTQNVTNCRKKTCSTCLFKESIPVIPFGSLQHAVPTRSLTFLRAEVPAVRYSGIMPIPSLQLQKKTCLMQRSRGFGHRVVVSKICYNAVIVLSVVLCDCCKPMNNCRDWAFSNSVLEVWLPAFQLPIFEKCEALPKGDLFDMFVAGIHAFCEI